MSLQITLMSLCIYDWLSIGDRYLSGFIKNTFICVLKMIESFIGLEWHGMSKLWQNLNFYVSYACKSATVSERRQVCAQAKECQTPTAREQKSCAKTTTRHHFSSKLLIYCQESAHELVSVLFVAHSLGWVVRSAHQNDRKQETVIFKCLEKWVTVVYLAWATKIDKHSLFTKITPK